MIAKTFPMVHKGWLMTLPNNPLARGVGIVLSKRNILSEDGLSGCMLSSGYVASAVRTEILSSLKWKSRLMSTKKSRALPRRRRYSPLSLLDILSSVDLGGTLKLCQRWWAISKRSVEFTL